MAPQICVYNTYESALTSLKLFAEAAAGTLEVSYVSMGAVMIPIVEGVTVWCRYGCGGRCVVDDGYGGGHANAL